MIRRISILLVAAAAVLGVWKLGVLGNKQAQVQDGVQNILEDGPRERLEDEKNRTLIFVGDIMLDRGVEYQAKKANDYKYPFLQVADFLGEVDLVAGNLEGPVVDEPVQYPIDSLRFNFDARMLEGLSFANISLLSLANNHTLNAEAEGLIQTKNHLDAVGLKYFGDPRGCDRKDVFEYEGMLFVGVNKTYPFNCADSAVVQLIKDLRKDNYDKLIFIFMHWGQEYREADVYQKNLAHLMIDAGADLIAGSHPHISQEIEKYRDKHIAYSLGNFVFDQNFSEETMMGIVLKVAVKGNKIKSVEPIDIGINGSFQPFVK